MLFDEFHERSLDADLGLALALDAQGALREDLRLLVDVGDARRRARRQADGRGAGDRERGPRLSGRDALSRPRSRGAHRGCRSCARRFARSPRRRGSILVFLPGQGEIRASPPTLGRARPRSRRRHRAALRRAGRARAGPRRRAGAAGAAQDRAGDLDRRDLADHRGRARRRRLRPDARAALRAGHRADAAGDGARLARQRRPAARARRAHRAGRLLSAVGGGGATAASRPSRRRKFWPPISPASRSISRSGASPIRRRSPSSIRRRAPRSPRRARCWPRSARSMATGASPTRAARSRGLALPPRLARMVVDAARAGDARPGGRDRRRCWPSAGSAATPSISTHRLDAFPPRPLAARRGRAAAGARLARARAGALAAEPRGRRGPAPSVGALARRRLSRPHRHGARQARRVPDGERPRRRRSSRTTRWRARPSSRSARSSAAPASARILAAAPLTLEEIEAVAGAAIETARRTDLRPRLRRVARAPAAPARRARLGRADACPCPPTRTARSRWRAGVLGLGVARLPWTQERSTQWRDRVAFLRRAEAERVAGSLRRGARRLARLARALSARQDRARRIGSDDLAAALKALLHYACRGGWRARRRRISSRRPARPSPWITRPRAGPAIALRVQELFGLDAASRAGGRPRAADAAAACRPRIARSRSPATCRASGAARGRTCARTCAAAIPAMSGPRIRRGRADRRGRSRGGREGAPVSGGERWFSRAFRRTAC